MIRKSQISHYLLWLVIAGLAGWLLISWDSAITANHRLDKLDTHNHFYFPAAVEPEIYILSQGEYDIQWKDKIREKIVGGEP